MNPAKDKALPQPQKVKLPMPEAMIAVFGLRLSSQASFCGHSDLIQEMGFLSEISTAKEQDFCLAVPNIPNSVSGCPLSY